MNICPMGKNCLFKKNRSPTNGKLFRSQRSPLNVMSTDSVKQTYVSVWGTKVSVCGIRLKEKSEDIILFVGFESHTYLFMGDYFPLEDYFPFVGDYFPLKGNNFPLIGITFGHDRIPSMEEIFHFNRSVCGIPFSVKVKQFSINRNHFQIS